MWDSLLTGIRKITFSGVGNVASILSFAITVYLLYTVRKIKSLYVFKARVPELVEDLREQASKLATFHQDFNVSRPQVLLEIGKAEVTLKDLKKKVGRPTRKSLAIVIKLIADYSPYNQTPDYLWKIYVELQKVIQEIIGLQSDRAWGNPNG